MDHTVPTVYGELAPCASKEAKLVATQFWPVCVESSLAYTGDANSPASRLSRFGVQLHCLESLVFTSGAYRNSSVRVYPVAWHRFVRLVGCCLVTSQWRSVKLRHRLEYLIRSSNIFNAYLLVSSSLNNVLYIKKFFLPREISIYYLFYLLLVLFNKLSHIQCVFLNQIIFNKTFMFSMCFSRENIVLR